MEFSGRRAWHIVPQSPENATGSELFTSFAGCFAIRAEKAPSPDDYAKNHPDANRLQSSERIPIRTLRVVPPYPRCSPLVLLSGTVASEGLANFPARVCVTMPPASAETGGRAAAATDSYHVATVTAKGAKPMFKA